MDQSNIAIVMSQTHVKDVDLIKECLEKCNGDVVNAIMMVSQLTPCQRNENETNISDHEKHMQNIRMIVNEKEELFHDVMANMKNAAQSSALKDC